MEEEDAALTKPLAARAAEAPVQPALAAPPMEVEHSATRVRNMQEHARTLIVLAVVLGTETQAVLVDGLFVAVLMRKREDLGGRRIVVEAVGHIEAEDIDILLHPFPHRVGSARDVRVLAGRIRAGLDGHLDRLEFLTKRERLYQPGRLGDERHRCSEFGPVRCPDRLFKGSGVQEAENHRIGIPRRLHEIRESLTSTADGVRKRALQPFHLHRCLLYPKPLYGPRY